ncbi:MAG: monothiol bacilliredoxin BrxC family protein [Bacteroidota bacterium]
MHNSADLDAALEASHQQPIVIFKHSASCPFSAAAQIEAAHAKHDLEVYGIVVQYTPDLKQEIADRLDVAHKSPQAIVVHRGKAVADYWRSGIKERTLKQDVKALRQPQG